MVQFNDPNPPYDHENPDPPNLFIQRDQPGSTKPYLWVETDDAGNVVTVWVFQ